MSLVTVKKSKDGRSIIIGGKKYPPTEYNLGVWKQYKVDGDRKKLRSNLSTVLLDFGDNK